MVKYSSKVVIDKLYAMRTLFGAEIAVKKAALLAQFNLKSLRKNDAILNIHELLLFMLTYADNAEVARLTSNAIKKLSQFLNEFQKSDPIKFSKQFDGSGIAYSTSTYAPSLYGCEWLLKECGENARIYWTDEYIGKLSPYLSGFAATVQQDGLTDNRFDGKDWLLLVSGKINATSNNDLRWLAGNIRQLKCENKIKDQLFEVLETEVQILLNKISLSRTGNILNHSNPFFQNGELLKKFDSVKKINEPINKITELKGAERTKIITSARATLASRERETDPVFYAERVFRAVVERGLEVYLFMMDQDHRLPIENYTGFVAYRNGVPIGYGGGWYFIERCEIGVNIFETFRGGENNLIFSNILRVYNQFFGVGKFVVQPYQFGEDNEEGLQSGAFWFYYKLGFRPEDPGINVIAEKEWKKICSRKDYRTSNTVLKKFTESPLVLNLHPSKIHFEPKKLSIAISSYVSKKFDGNIQIALASSKQALLAFKGTEDFKKWPMAERKSFEALSPLVAFSSTINDWNSDEQRSIIKLLQLKAGDELLFSVAFKKSTKLLKKLKLFTDKNDINC